MPTNRLSCPSCGAGLKLAVAVPAGKAVKCPKCAAVFKAPAAVEAPAGPPQPAQAPPAPAVQPTAPLTIRIYLCAHFADTRAERDHLHAVVFPELRRRFDPGVLRVEVVDHGKTKAETAAGLRQALHSIDECRPWFLCLLGDGNGPALTTAPADALAEYPELAGMLPASRLELEVWHGLLRDDRPTAGLVYCRDGSAALWLGRLTGPRQSRRAAVRNYTLRLDEQHTPADRLRTFGERVLADLTAAVQAVLQSEREYGLSVARTVVLIRQALAERGRLEEQRERAEEERRHQEWHSQGREVVRPSEQPLYVDENVQFTVYRPRVVAPAKWYPLLAFAHLSERPPDAPPGTPDPVEEVYRQARQVLGAQAKDYQDVTQDSRLAVPREGELTLVPEMPGVTFNPPRRSFLWTEPVHREEFRLKAGAALDGKTVRGRLTVFLGAVILADVPLTLRVDARHRSAAEDAEAEKARPYRKIFASYSHRDLHVVQQVEQLARVFGDQYLRDWTHLRAGEVWDDRLLELIRQADVFQLFWSKNAMRSPYCRREWEYALSLGRPHFIRPTYWEEPLPATPDGSLPPPELRRLHFQRIFAEMRTHPALPAAPEDDTIDLGAAPGEGDSDRAMASAVGLPRGEQATADESPLEDSEWGPPLSERAGPDEADTEDSGSEVVSLDEEDEEESASAPAAFADEDFEGADLDLEEESPSPRRRKRGGRLLTVLCALFFGMLLGGAGLYGVVQYNLIEGLVPRVEEERQQVRHEVEVLKKQVEILKKQVEDLQQHRGDK
jgi:cell division protein FtsB